MAVYLLGLKARFGFDKRIKYFYSERPIYSAGDEILVGDKPGGTLYDVESVQKYASTSDFPTYNYVKQCMDEYTLAHRKTNRRPIIRNCDTDYEPDESVSGPYRGDSIAPYESDPHWDDKD